MTYARSIGLMLCIGQTAVAQQRTPAPAGYPVDLDAYIVKAMHDWDIPGLSLTIVRNDSVLVAKGFGVRELGKPGAVDANTVFNIASITKSFTATAAAMLVDDGRLLWDAPVRRYLPALEFAERYLTDQVTIRDLLSHRTGLHGSNMMWVLTDIDKPEMIRRARYLPAEQPFRTQEVYSNVGYTIAGEGMAAAAGLSYEDLVMRRIIQPLHMTSTTVSAGAVAQQPNVVSPHAIIGGVQRPIAWRNIDIISPAGSINSTANDMAKWLRFQMADGVVDGTRLVSSASLWQTHSPQALIPVTPAMKRARLVESIPAYGMGWNIMDYRGHPLLWHSGNADGQPAIMGILPDDHVGVVIMMNTWAGGNLHGLLMNRVFDIYLGAPPRDWSGEAMPSKAAIRAGYSVPISQFESSHVAGTQPSHPLSAFAGRYVDSLYGPQTVRLENGSLTLQMGGAHGQIADLTHWHYDTYLVRWRDPLFNEVYLTLVTFGLNSAGAVDGLVMHINRDHIAAARVGPP